MVCQLEQTFPRAAACVRASWRPCHRAARDDVDGSSWALPEDLGLGLLWWGSYCALLACLQDQTFPFSAAPSQGQRSPPLRDCFGSGTAAAEQCRRPGALGPDRDLPRNGALTVEQVGSGVAIEKPQGLGLLFSHSL